MECGCCQFADPFYVLDEKHQGFSDGTVVDFNPGSLGSDFEFGWQRGIVIEPD